METAPELVVAAEAVRTWVVAQREGWKAPHPALSSVSGPVAAPERPATPLRPAPATVPGRDAAPAATPAAPLPPMQSAPVTGPRASAPPIVLARPVPVESAPPELVMPAAAPASAPAPVSTAPPHVAPVEHRAAAEVDEEVEAAPSRGWLRPVLALAAVLVLAVGGFLVRGRSAQLTAAPKSGTAVLTSDPVGAEVVIDGTPSGNTPLTLNLPAGKHQLEFRLKAATRRQTIEIARGKETTVDIDWNSKPLGSLHVEVRPTPARVLVDGKDRGEAPLTLTDLTVGAHTVQIDTAEGSVRRRVEIGEGRVEALTEEIFPGWLHVSSPIELTVVDGKKAVQLDASNRVLLKPGAHTIRLENTALGIAETRQVTIEPGGTAKVTVAPQESTLTVLGSSGAEVFVDGTKAGETPLVDFKVRLGPHDVMVVERGGATRHASVTVTAKPAMLEIFFDRP
ncbi:MAG: PEGA domain-containing protein [Vicinamibacterales bacterium]